MALYRKREIKYSPGPPVKLDVLWDENNRPLRYDTNLILSPGEQKRIDSGLWVLKTNMVVTFRNFEEVENRTAKLVGNAILNTDPELIEE